MPGVWNKSTVVTDDDVKRMAAACNKQMSRDFCPDWQFVPWAVGFQSPLSAVVTIVDTAKDVPGALAYHDWTSGKPVGVVLAKTIKDYCFSKGLKDYKFGPAGISVALSHELLEMRADDTCTVTTYNQADGNLYWREVCDAVQDSDYDIDGVRVSNYVTRHWFEPQGRAPFDRLGHLRKPFQLEKGGYQVVSKPGPETQVNGKLESSTLGEAPPYHGWRSLQRSGL